MMQELQTGMASSPGGGHRITDRIGMPLMLGVFAVILVVIGQILSPRFASLNNMMQLAKLASFMGIVAIGQTIVILTGGIDLSVAWTLTGAAFAFTTIDQGMAARIPEAAAGALAVGVAIGLINGIGVAKLRVAPIVMTLAMNSILQGLTLVCTSGSPLGVPAVLRRIAVGSVGPVPTMVIVWAILTILVVVAISMTGRGRQLLSVGENPRVSELSGINNAGVVIVAYVLSGISAAFAGVLFAGFSNTSFLGMGDQFVLPTIAAVVLGGTSILGGSGGYGGTVAGVIFITLLSTDLLIENISAGVRDIVFAFVVIAAMMSQKFLSPSASSDG
jgi:ribose transport system permease protein